MPLDCDKIDACAAKLDALSRRFDNYVRVRKDAEDQKAPTRKRRMWVECENCGHQWSVNHKTTTEVQCPECQNTSWSELGD